MRKLAALTTALALAACSTGDFASTSSKSAPAAKPAAKTGGKDDDDKEGSSGSSGSATKKDSPGSASGGSSAEEDDSIGGDGDRASVGAAPPPPLDEALSALESSFQDISGTNYIIIFKNNANASPDDFVGFREYDGSWPRSIILDYGYDKADARAAPLAFGPLTLPSNASIWPAWDAAALAEPAAQAYLKDRIDTLRAVAKLMDVKFPAGYDPTKVDVSRSSSQDCEQYNSTVGVSGSPKFEAIDRPRFVLAIESGGGKDGSPRRTWLAREGDSATSKCGSVDLSKWPATRELLRQRAKRILSAPTNLWAIGGAMGLSMPCPTSQIPEMCAFLAK